MFIVSAVILCSFAVMARHLKAKNVSAVVIVGAYSNSLTLIRPEVKKQLVDMLSNGSGVRDMARTLKIGVNTVIRTLKKLRQNE